MQDWAIACTVIWCVCKSVCKSVCVIVRVRKSVFICVCVYQCIKCLNLPRCVARNRSARVPTCVCTTMGEHARIRHRHTHHGLLSPCISHLTYTIRECTHTYKTHTRTHTTVFDFYLWQ